MVKGLGRTLLRMHLPGVCLVILITCTMSNDRDSDLAARLTALGLGQPLLGELLLREGPEGELVAESADGLRFRVGSMPATDSAIARRLAEDQAVALLSLYREVRSPYPGPLSNRQACPKSLSPRPIGRAEGLPAFAYKASARDAPGVCTPEQAARSCLLQFRHCRGRLLRISACFSTEPPETVRQAFLALDCLHEATP